MGLLSTSGIIVIVCVMTALYVMSRRNRPAAPVAFGAERFAEDVLDDSVLSAQETHALENPAVPERPVAVAPRAKKPTSAGSGYRWGRIAIFGLGALSLGGAVATGIAAPFTPVSWTLPALLFAFAVLAVATLRVLAVRDRDRRRAQTEAHVHQRKPRATSTPAPVAETELKPAPVLTEKDRQQLPVNHAVKSLRKARTSHQPGRNLAGTATRDQTPPPVATSTEQPLTQGTWQPVAVPRPTYLDAPAAHRPLPEPANADPAPAAQSETLAQAASLNLDEVLRRRRA